MSKITLEILFSVFAILVMPKLIWHIRKKRHTFSGKIESYKDVNDFLLNYKYFIFCEREDYYSVVTKTFSWTHNDYSYSYRRCVFYPGIYISDDNSDDWRYMLVDKNKELLYYSDYIKQIKLILS
ncbi:MAG: hypothetical protein ACYCSB_01210 [bacterium]|jgi:hypothetical protein